VAQKATDVVARLRSAQPSAKISPPLFDEFAGTLQPLARTPFPAAVAIGPEVPIVDKIGAITGQAGLVRVNRPVKPTTTHGRSTITDNSGGQSRHVPVDWVHSRGAVWTTIRLDLFRPQVWSGLRGSS